MSLGFTGGVMIAASFWSLLAPSIQYVEMQKELGYGGTDMTAEDYLNE